MCFMGIYSIVIALLKVVWTLARMLLLSTQIQGRSWYCWWHEIERANVFSKIWCTLLDSASFPVIWYCLLRCSQWLEFAFSCFFLIMQGKCPIKRHASTHRGLQRSLGRMELLRGLSSTCARTVSALHLPSDLTFYFSHAVTYSVQLWYRSSTAIQMCDPLNHSSPCTCSYGRWVWLWNKVLVSPCFSCSTANTLYLHFSN